MSEDVDREATCKVTAGDYSKIDMEEHHIEHRDSSTLYRWSVPLPRPKTITGYQLHSSFLTGNPYTLRPYMSKARFDLLQRQLLKSCKRDVLFNGMLAALSAVLSIASAVVACFVLCTGIKMYSALVMGCSSLVETAFLLRFWWPPITAFLPLRMGSLATELSRLHLSLALEIEQTHWHIDLKRTASPDDEPGVPPIDKYETFILKGSKPVVCKLGDVQWNCLCRSLNITPPALMPAHLPFLRNSARLSILAVLLGGPPLIVMILLTALLFASIPRCGHTRAMCIVWILLRAASVAGLAFLEEPKEKAETAHSSTIEEFNTRYLQAGLALVRIAKEWHIQQLIVAPVEEEESAAFQ